MFDLIGKTIGPYRVVEQVGVGGMATVYKAYQPSMDRYVAIKILPHYLSQDPEFVKRFQREARAIAKLEHAHILPVHDYGEYEGIAYIVMRYVEAGTLKDRMAQGQLPLDEIDRLIEQIGGALDYAHRLGVIHRDIKPGNVLLDTQGDTYLSDFGLARMMEATQQLTASGVGVGTPAYMSPEQGQGVKVDHRSDIYSLGIILYEMVTGKVPFEAETPMAVMIKHITDPLPLPRTVKPDVPEPVERVILKALAKDQAHRYQTAGDMVQALAVAVRQASAEPAEQPAAAPARPSPAREDVSLVTRVQRAWEQPRGKVALVGGALVVLVVLGLLLSRLPGSVAIVGPGMTATLASPTLTTPKTELSANATPQLQVTQAQTPPLTTEATYAVTPVRVIALGPQDQMEQARAFAEPVLAAIANRPPDYQDDLSDPKSGWPSATYADGERSGEIGYKDGEYFLIANPASARYPTVHSWLQIPAPDISDFVMEFDARVISAGHGSIYVHFRVQEKNVYAAEVAPEGWMRLATQTISDDTLLAETRVSPIKPNEVNRVRIIAKGPRIALYLNDRAVLMADKEFTDQGGIILGIWNGSSTPMQVNFDNFKVWHITPSLLSTEPLTPQAEQARAFAEPILQAIAERKPDFEDDFSTGGRGWRSSESYRIENGSLEISVPEGETYGGAQHSQMWASDFVFQVDAQADVLERDSYVGIQLRGNIPGSYSVSLYPQQQGSWMIYDHGDGTALAQGSAPDVVAMGQWMKVVIIARGSQFAVLVNDQPIAYFVDDTIPDGQNALNAGGPGGGRADVKFDNVKFWNLENVPGLP